MYAILIFILVALMIPFAGTALGSAFVFFMKKEIPNRLQKAHTQTWAPSVLHLALR